ncbi:cation:proton antiporter [Apilactobacillus sp. EABW-1NA]|uniref:cation:proton antiporter n=1 Tax=Apilactobacillus sp. EABW-1NA TaxID=2984137 RepID=UPI002207C8F7|nr:cation:proton antiporter [Apilactobacillus sp. EABW-1NA]CAI2549856.1 Na(+)/H(+) antiporter [Apilactobacillus kunkeei]MDN2613224.1 cation:proton antiporter [Apilactobacillus sp. EABW-1NA]CAI2550248.1 Na(+)/H(+) antiporter [Apilactobacillus kunkeei]CAI2550330.1 Na(+)/H(+) antiporter [Apilactobacillus kunkeei]CAI2550510.1 Na(+)/H(+) antiporter [Apilactobacillus kunkeei]
MDYILSVSIILLASLITGKIFTKISLPPVVGQLIAGVIIGPAILNIVKPTNLISSLAELGVILLMFIAGLESDLKLLKKYFKPSIVVAIMGIIFPVVGIFCTSKLFALSNIESLFIGVIFAATSVSISVAVLKNMKALNTKPGVTILGAAVADDILSILLLSIVITFTSGSSVQGNPNIFLLILMQIGFFIFVWILFILVKQFKIKLAPTLAPIVGLIVCLSLSALAEHVQISAITGAFFAGILIGQTNYKESVNHQMNQFGNLLFIPIFFVNVGLNMNISGIVENASLFLFLSIVAVITKFLGAYLGSRLFKFDRLSATEIGVGMISRGEVGLIIAEIGLKNNLISDNYYSTIIASIILTTILAPLLLKPIVMKTKQI